MVVGILYVLTFTPLHFFVRQRHICLLRRYFQYLDYSTMTDVQIIQPRAKIHLKVFQKYFAQVNLAPMNQFRPIIIRFNKI